MLAPMRHNETTALEYATFKVPYEELNKRFRNGQRAIERATLRVREAATALEAQLGGREAVDREKLAGPVSHLASQLESLRDTISIAVDEEEAVVERMRQRVKAVRVAEELPADSLQLQQWRRDRINRMLVDHLVRCGFLASARLLAERCGLLSMCDVDVFERAAKVEQSLLDFDTRQCLEWINDHRSKLRRMESRLETAVRVQETVELIRARRTVDALQHVQKYLTNGGTAGMPAEVLRLMGLLGVGASTKIDAYVHMLNPERWKELAALFTQEVARMYQLSSQSPFGACLQIGLAAHKTPQCTSGGHDKCYACDPIAFQLAEGLPYSHTGISRVYCALTGDPLNEDNVPLMLPSGRVYGERAIQTMRDGDMIRIPGEDPVGVSQLQRLFVL